TFYLFTVYIYTYCRKTLGLEDAVVLRAVIAASALEFLAIPAFGILSDFYSRKGLYLAGCLFLVLFAFPYFALLDTRRPELVLTAVVVSLIGGHAVLFSIQGSLIPELFGTRVRYTGASLGYQLAAPLGGGLAPIVATFLDRLYPREYWPLALYIILVAGV